MAKSKQIKKKVLPEIKIDQILLSKRIITIYDVIDEKSISKATQQLFVLDSIAVAPIYLWINSPGGHVTDGFGFIDVMNTIQSPVITIACGCVASMGALIFIAGNKRLITPNTTVMFHDLRAGGYDYGDKIIARAEWIKTLQTQIFKFIAENTKLTPKELEKARHEELWLSAEDSVRKGVADALVGGAKK